ncbi:hypothetical protein H7I41_00920 [Mycobacterium manitobense]|uniref:Uncharacterized protein n=1 Tax=[Mycobacterium] manitobense TaxID=190147 RepID=A0A9X2YIR3_9MYCO|nr:hypothetical protein [[Mycobacterium] manitobense]MCV7168474.1 hypothetical protein [[Mycobacterium] manitobense]
MCATSPGDGMCSGGPYAAPATPPPIGSGLPGSLNPDGTPFGSEPPTGISGMPGSIPGMPGTP